MAKQNLTEEQKKSLKKVCDIYIESEETHFQETYDVDIEDMNDSEIIALCEKEGYTDHTYYDILILKQLY